MNIKIEKQPGHKWTDEQRQFLRDNIKGKTKKEVYTLFNATFGTSLIFSQVACMIKNLGLRSGVVTRFKKGDRSYPRGIGYQRRCTKQEVEWLRKNRDLPNYLLMRLFNEAFNLNYTERKIESVKRKHGIKNTKGGVSRFITGIEKGNIPPMWVPIGSERTTSTGGYVEVKIKDGCGFDNWAFKHRLIWETANGPIPEGHVVIFADGNIRNFELSNLRLITRGENGLINGHIKRVSDAGVTDASISLAKLKMAVYQHETKTEKGNSQP